MQKERPGGVTVEPDDHGLGRSRGGLTAKLHLTVEQGQKPMAIVTTTGQRAIPPQFEALLIRIRVPGVGPGRPRTVPGRIVCGTASAVNTEHLSELAPRIQLIPAPSGLPGYRAVHGDVPAVDVALLRAGAPSVHLGNSRVLQLQSVEERGGCC